MTYPQVAEGEEATDSEYVSFDAFFLRDLDGDGYAESLRGSCRKIGESDLLYIDLKVIRNGYLENGYITINGNNFYLQGSLPKDNIVKENVIGNNIKRIELNKINNGTQKLFTGSVRSGDYSYRTSIANAIGNDITNYSKKNTIVLRGTHVATDGTRTEINKKVELQMDWYGDIKNIIRQTEYTRYDRDSIADEENNELNLGVNIKVGTEGDLILKKAVIEGVIPQFNGYNPIRVETTKDDVTLEYDSNTRNFRIIKEAIWDEEKGRLTNVFQPSSTDNTYRNYTYSLNIVYPLEAYNTLGTDSVEIRIPISVYHEAYNNPNAEFGSPKTSNIAKATIITNYTRRPGTVSSFYINVGKRAYITEIGSRYIVSKQKPIKIYNGLSDKEENDTYIVNWYAYTGTDGESTGLTLKEKNNNGDIFITKDNKEISMEQISTNIGIYFSSASNMLGEEGWIKVYDNESGELLETFTKENWNQYSESNPYKYEIPVKHIRVETSSTIAEKSIYVYNVKELDDDYITKNFTRNEFDNLEYIKSTLEGSLGQQKNREVTNRAKYEAPFTVTRISINKKQLSTQKKEKNITLTINAEGNEKNNEENWVNGTFLLKLPKEILDVEIENVRVSNRDVKILSYEKFEENGEIYIKINTENEEPKSFYLYIDCNISPDPRSTSVTEKIELYAYNENATDYLKKTKDIYDVNDNLNKEEMVAYATIDIDLISPSSLLTSQLITNYDDEGSIAVAPQIGEITKKRRTADINIAITNNYDSTISEVTILGRTLFAGNKYVMSSDSLNSTFTATMTNEGIKIPEELKEKVIIYYSEKEEATKDLQDSNNAWTTTPADFGKVRSYLIDLQGYALQFGESYMFTYTVNIPENIEYNNATFGHHAVYFSLDTEEGKYRTQTEPNKVGLELTKEYDLQVTKYQKGKNNLVSGATYSITDENGEAKTKVTGEDGKLEVDGLKAYKTYILKEIKTPSDYELNPEEVEFKITEENDELKINIISGTVRNSEVIKQPEKQKDTIALEVEDEINANLKITKFVQGTNDKVAFMKFKLTGKNFEKGKIFTTNSNGEITAKGLKIGEVYTLEEIKSEDYYLIAPIKFKITNENGEYKLSIIEGTVKKSEIVENDNLPIALLEIENEKVPTYNLRINKVVKDENKPLADAKFRLTKGSKIIGNYTTDAQGIIEINDLYAFEESRDIDQTYTLKETMAPDGYATIKDIIFQVSKKEEGLEIEIKEGKAKETTIEENTVIITIEDSPSFKLIKKDGEIGTVLPNTKFAIYNIDNGTEQLALDSKNNILGTKEVIDGKEYYTLTTNEKGEITANLREGLYKAVEIKACDEKYDITDNTYYFGIGASREIIEDFICISKDNSDILITDIKRTEDGGCIVVGYDDYTPFSDWKIIKYDQGGAIEWEKSIDETGIGPSIDEYISIETIEKTDDGGYLVGGSKSSMPIPIEPDEPVGPDDPAETEIYIGDGAILIKYDANGEIEWSKSFGYNSVEPPDPETETDEIQIDEITTIVKSKNGEYIVGGNFYSNITIGDYKLTSNTTENDIFIMKCKQTGEIEKVQTFGGNKSDKIKSLIPTKDGGYIVLGDFYSDSITFGSYTLNNNGTDSKDIMIIKYNQADEIEWATSVGGSSTETVISGISASDEGIVVVGNFTSDNITIDGNTLTNNGKTDGMILKYNKNGKIEWAKSIGGTAVDTITAIALTSKDDNFVISGTINSEDVQMGETLIEKGTVIIECTKDGNIDFTSKVDNVVTVEKIEEINIDEYFLGISNYDDTHHSSNSAFGRYIRKEVGNPKVIQAKSINGEGYETIRSVIETADGGYIAVGGFESKEIKIDEYSLENKSLYSNYNDGIIIKYNSEGKTEWVKQIEGESNDIIDVITQTKDEGFIIGINSGSSSITIDEKTIDAGNGVVKFTKSGEIEWTESISGTKIMTIKSTSDNGFIIGGISRNSKIKIGDIILNNDSYREMGILVKYNNERKVEWIKVLGQSENSGEVGINIVSTTKDGGYLVGGYFKGESIEIGDYTLTNQSNSKSDSDALIVKYSKTGKEEWVMSVGKNDDDEIKSIAETKDGGFIVAVKYSYNGSEIIKYSKNREIEWKRSFTGSMATGLETNIIMIPSNKGGYIVGVLNNVIATQVIKYDDSGILEWEKEIGTNIIGRKIINSLFETSDGAVLIGGIFENENIEIDGNVLTNSGSADGMVLKIINYEGVKETSEITAENYRKEFKITTEIEKISGVKGGSISGEKLSPYETVKYDETSTKEIVMQPDENHEIIKITVNEKEWPFTSNEDGTYTMPQFENMREDKHVVVTYSLKENKIVVNKIDSKTKEPIPGAKFQLDQIEERTNPVNVIGTLTGNSNTYTEADKTAEITGVQGSLTNNGTYYFVKQADGTYIPTNGKTYQLANGGTAGIKSSTASSYIPIDLTGKTGKYHIVVNARASCASSNDGYVVINQSTTAPTSPYASGSFINLYGTSSSTTTAKDYTSAVLEGGKTYYLHLNYKKGSSTDTGEDQIVINSVKVYKAKDVQYNFANTNGTYTSTNQGKANTVSASYIPIDLTNATGKYNLTVKAKISSGNSDYGYVTVTNTTTAPTYNNEEGRIVYISGTSSSVTTAKEYTTVIEGGQKYYLHLGYRKGSSSSYGMDTFTVSDIKVTLNDVDLWHVGIETNSKGQAITQIPFGKYKLTETTTPEGYQTLEKPAIIEFRANNKSVLENENSENIAMNSNGEIVVENSKKIKVTVHHYLKDRDGNYTITKLLEDETLYGNTGEDYITKPNLNIDKYELEKDISGQYVIPEEATGTLQNDDIEITYYYEEKKIPVTVNHYIEGTTTPVPLKNGEEAESTTINGYEGETYTTTEIPDEELSEEYELSLKPTNSEGTYTEATTVTYYYKKVSRNINITKYSEDGTTPLEGAKFTINKVGEEIAEQAEIYTTNSEGKIKVNIEIGEYEITEIEAPEGYVLPENPTLNVVITKATTEENLEITNDKIKGKVIVHHYIKDSNTPVKLQDGTYAKDEIKQGYLGAIYATKALENLSTQYRYYSVVGQISGEYAEGTIEVIYYYEELTDVEISKKWDHTNNIYGKPESITIELLADGVVIGETTMTRENKVTIEGEPESQETWKYTFEGLPKYNDSNREIIYTIREK